MEYPGYSIYSGQPSAAAILEDADVVYDYLTKTVGVQQKDIIIFGRSIGSGPACYLAARKDPGALVLMSAYTSIKEVVRNVAGNFAKWFVAERFKNIDEITKVKSPILFIHGGADTLIPKEHSLELYKACPHSYKEILIPKNMTHNDFDLEQDIIKPIFNFWERFDIKVKKGEKQYIFPEIRSKL